jgi:hypothetical protein
MSSGARRQVSRDAADSFPGPRSTVRHRLTPSVSRAPAPVKFRPRAIGPTSGETKPIGFVSHVCSSAPRLARTAGFSQRANRFADPARFRLRAIRPAFVEMKPIGFVSHARSARGRPVGRGRMPQGQNADMVGIRNGFTTLRWGLGDIRFIGHDRPLRTDDPTTPGFRRDAGSIVA